MEKFLYFFVHLIIPAIIIIVLLKNKPKSKISLITSSALSASIIFFLYLWGQWPLVGSYYLRYLMIVILIIIVFYSAKRFSFLTLFWPQNRKRLLVTLPIGLLSIYVLMMCANLISGSTYSEKSIELFFPLKKGNFYIASGGSNKLVNNHMRDYPNSQQFALDINKLSKYGGVNNSFLSAKNTSHYIFSTPVYSPCDGVVVNSVDGIIDNLKASTNVSRKNGKGNFITIKCGNTLISVYHLKKNSVLKSIGDNVAKEEKIGLVGNSGFSQEPHLHIQAAKYNADSVLVGVPMKFKKGTVSRNDIISN
jgi:hypothetical protein